MSDCGREDLAEAAPTRVPERGQDFSLTLRILGESNHEELMIAGARALPRRRNGTGFPRAEEDIGGAGACWRSRGPLRRGGRASARSVGEGG